MKIKGPNNLHMETTKQGETQPPKSLKFEYLHSYTESQFQLFQIRSKCVPNGIQKPSKLKPAGVFGANKLVGEGFKKHTQK